MHGLRLLLQRLGGGGTLLDQRRVLLRRLVHARQGSIDVIDPGRLLAAAIAATMLVTLLIDVTISLSAVPARLTSSTPSCTWLLELLSRSLMSFAACEERCARSRTSDATTAKPRPASPARAASTAALSASRLVCLAISSITPMMSAIRREEPSMFAIASTTLATTLPPRSATAQVPSAD